MTTDAQIKTEKLFIDSLVSRSIEAKKISTGTIEDIIRLTGDASSRRYYRVFRQKDCFVVCLQQPSENKTDDFLNIQSIYEKNNIRVPKIFDYDLSKGYLLEEDLGDITLLKELSGLESQKEELKQYNLALESLFKIQSIKRDDYVNESFTKRYFDIDKLMWEVEFTVKHLIEGFLKADVGPTEKKVIINGFRKICKKLTEQKMVVTHRDFHSRNIMSSQGEQIIIDFQDTRIGLPQYDLVSLLEDCYYKISPKNKMTLKEQYWTEFVKKKSLQESEEEYLYLYELMTIQRTFKALGSFGYIYALRGDSRYLKYIGYSFEKLRNLLFNYEEFSNLRKVLSEYYYES